MSLEDRVCLVTGASRGLGLAVGRAFLREGARLVVASRTAGRLEAAWAEESRSGRVLAVTCDVTSEPDVLALFEKALERFSRVDAVVNNAGTPLVCGLTETTLEQWNRILAVHATGPFLVSREAVRQMVREKIRGRIINVSSVLGTTGGALATAYSAAKAAVLGFTKALAKEVMAQGITVNAVVPGAIDTDMMQATIDAMAERFRADPAKLRASAVAAIPQKRLLDPAEVADLIAYLAGDRASGITGQTYPITCGLEIH